MTGPVPALLTIGPGSRVDAVARPAMPGLRLRVDGLQGTVPSTADVTGDGGFSCVVRAEAEPGGAVAVPGWLRAGPALAVGRVVTLERTDAASTVVTMTVDVGGRQLVLAGSTRTRRRADASDGAGAIESAGAALCDPRALGVALPPLITHVLTVRWQVRLAAP